MGIYKAVAPIIFVPQMLMTPVTKEIVADTASGGTWIYRILQQVSSKSINGSNKGETHNAIGIIEPSSPVMIVIVGTSPPC